MLYADRATVSKLNSSVSGRSKLLLKAVEQLIGAVSWFPFSAILLNLQQLDTLFASGGLKNPNVQTNKHGEDVHEGVECDHCHICPIVGPRFCSQVINDYDLCKTCYSLPECDALAPFRIIQRLSEEHAGAMTLAHFELCMALPSVMQCLHLCFVLLAHCVITAQIEMVVSSSVLMKQRSYYTACSY